MASSETMVWSPPGLGEDYRGWSSPSLLGRPGGRSGETLPPAPPVAVPFSPQDLGAICLVLVSLGRAKGRAVCDLQAPSCASWGNAWFSSRGDKHSFWGRLSGSRKAFRLTLGPHLPCPSPGRWEQGGSGLLPIAGYPPRARSSVLPPWKPHVGSLTHWHSDCEMTVTSLQDGSLWG